MALSSVTQISRRGVLAGVLALGTNFPAISKPAGQRATDEVIESAVARGDVQGVVAMVASPEAVIYRGAFGKRDVSAGRAMSEDTIFKLYSMTKPITSVAALQLVERGKVRLDDRADKFLPAVAQAKVLVDSEPGKTELRPPKTPITVRHLLTHTSGYAYPYWSQRLHEYTVKSGETEAADHVLMFDPGEHWLYGVSTDVLGRLVEAASGSSLDHYFRDEILSPLGMTQTGFVVAPTVADRLATLHQRGSDGALRESKQKAPEHLQSYSAGSGLYGTASDYLAFMQMVLRGGRFGSERLLGNRSIQAMTSNQIGSLVAGQLQSAVPELSNDVDFHPGFHDKFGLGFLINPVAYGDGRSPGSLAWAGAANTFFWIDPRKKLCAVLLMQILPFFDTKAVALLRSFEAAVYRV